MNTHECRQCKSIVALERVFAFALMFLALTLGGCMAEGEREREIATSGDPEADLRAEQRIGSARDDDKDDGEEDRTLYERLGGADNIRALVDDMTARVIADPRVNFERKDVSTNPFGGEYKPWNPTTENVDGFKHHMVEFLTLAAGGPAEYTGRDMRSVHEGMKITNNEFDAMVGDLKASMDKLGLGTREQRDVLAIIETTRKQIVEK
jgi:hemoglobin